MTGWMRYPGRLAHLVTKMPTSLEGYADRELAKRVRTVIGSRWQTSCNRELLVFFDEVQSPSAEWVDPVDLRAERPRAFCLRCLYWAAHSALVLDHRSLRRFIDDVESGALPGLTWPEGLQ
jgi:hypothetical protein